MNHTASTLIFFLVSAFHSISFSSPITQTSRPTSCLCRPVAGDGNPFPKPYTETLFYEQYLYYDKFFSSSSSSSLPVSICHFLVSTFLNFLIASVFGSHIHNNNIHSKIPNQSVIHIGKSSSPSISFMAADTPASDRILFFFSFLIFM